MLFPEPQSAADLMKEEEGPWASVSYCAGSAWFQEMYGPKPITRHIHATSSDAYKAKAWIDECGCGGGCEEWHRVEKALPKEKVGRGKSIERRHYARYGGTIPDIFLLPAERQRQKDKEVTP